jgi:hypothetical protein
MHLDLRRPKNEKKFLKFVNMIYCNLFTFYSKYYLVLISCGMGICTYIQVKYIVLIQIQL